jgi:hypothetical protein
VTHVHHCQRLAGFAFPANVAEFSKIFTNIDNRLLAAMTMKLRDPQRNVKIFLKNF